MSASDVAIPSQEPTLYPEESLKELVEAGVFYGRKKSSTNPKMKPYILTNRGGIHLINLLKTKEGLEKALDFLKEKVQGGGLVLVVGTQPAAQNAVKELAFKFHLPYVTNRWLGGTLTNFKVILNRIEYLKKLRSDLAAGAFEQYTKKERLNIEREVRRLEELLGGLEALVRLPAVLVVVDPKLHMTAIQEARHLKIPVIALADVDSDPETVEYVVVGNNKSRKSIVWFLEKIEVVLKEISPPSQSLPNEQPH